MDKISPFLLAILLIIQACKPSDGPIDPVVDPIPDDTTQVANSPGFRLFYPDDSASVSYDGITIRWETLDPTDTIYQIAIINSYWPAYHTLRDSTNQDSFTDIYYLQPGRRYDLELSRGRDTLQSAFFVENPFLRLEGTYIDSVSRSRWDYDLEAYVTDKYLDTFRLSFEKGHELTIKSNNSRNDTYFSFHEFWEVDEGYLRYVGGPGGSSGSVAYFYPGKDYVKLSFWHGGLGRPTRNSVTLHQ
ncbi:MAG: hypothetical protein R3B47_09780 [Bacteroidia bacterium]